MLAMESNGRSKPAEEIRMEPRSGIPRGGRSQDTKRFSCSKNRFVTSCLRGLFVLLFCIGSARADQSSAASDVLKRLIGDRTSNFTFEQIPADNGNDVYEIEARDGKVIVRGNTPISMSRGAYAYL